MSAADSSRTITQRSVAGLCAAFLLVSCILCAHTVVLTIRLERERAKLSAPRDGYVCAPLPPLRLDARAPHTAFEVRR